jgi:ABC-type transporter Mla MlaB component
MDILRIQEKAEEVRVEVEGTLRGDLVVQLLSAWQECQSRMFWRRFAVDISKLQGYDDAGRALLHEMYRCGTLFSAGTPSALEHLQRIAAIPTVSLPDPVERSQPAAVDRPSAARRPCRPSAHGSRLRAAAH